MQFRNTKERFGVVTKTFHLSIALLILCLVPMGIFLADYAETKTKLQLFPYHKEFGICVLILATARVMWHIVSRPPEFVASLKPWEKWGARVAHALLYLAMFAMPLSGWLLSSAAGRTVSFFGIDLPNVVAQSKETKEFFEEVHEVVGWGLIPLVGAHVAGALKHHFFDKDITLRRMLPFGLKDTGEKLP